MSNKGTTKLFFDEELNLELLEGGTIEVMYDMTKERKKKPEAPNMPDEDRAGFVRKTFGLFFLMILAQVYYVVRIT